MREFQECNSDHTLLKKAENLRNIIEELKGLSGQSNYSAILKKGINEFETNWRTTITPQEFEHLEHPDKMDIDEMIREKYCSLASNYRRYWESAIAQLVFRQESSPLQNRKGQYPLNLRVSLHHLELDILIHIGTSPSGIIILSANHS